MATSMATGTPGTTGPPPGNGRGWRRDGGEGGGYPGSLRPGTHRLGMVLALAGISMLFVGMTSALVVRQGLDAAWRSIPMPPLLFANTALLLASSLALELARRAGPTRPRALRRRVMGAFLLGLFFLAGQIVVWRQLAGTGIFFATNAHSSFFYMLTALHGLHLSGGLVALGWLARSVGANAGGGWGFDVTALYWHFMDGLWVYLLVLLFVLV